MSCDCLVHFERCADCSIPGTCTSQNRLHVSHGYTWIQLLFWWQCQTNISPKKIATRTHLEILGSGGFLRKHDCRHYRTPAHVARVKISVLKTAASEQNQWPAVSPIIYSSYVPFQIQWTSKKSDDLAITPRFSILSQVLRSSKIFY